MGGKNFNNGLVFPAGFLWGAAASAYQVEGGNNNDWSEWEKENAGRLTKEAENKWPKWQQEKFPGMFDFGNYISGRACDHYSLFEKDFDIAESLSHNAHRFSIEWSRVEPEEGNFDEKEIEHYRKVISALRARGMEPFITLWHWTNPLWISKMGGWANDKTPDYFLRFVKKIFGEYKDLAKFWIPVNEPGAVVSLGYGLGLQPPGIKNIFLANRVFKNLMEAQKKVYNLNRSGNYGFQIGCSHFSFDIKPYNNYFWNTIAAEIIKYMMDGRYLNIFQKYSDFLGVQYYRSFLVNIKLGGRVLGLVEDKQSGKKVSDLNWEIYPEGILHVLRNMAKYKKPIYITENGIADAEDTQRTQFIKEHLQYVYRAIAEGADVRGYFYWSLLDNFEMPEVRGFWPRFGLVEIDYKTMERKIRKSALEYAQICKNNKIEI